MYHSWLGGYRINRKLYMYVYCICMFNEKWQDACLYCNVKVCALTATLRLVRSELVSLIYVHLRRNGVLRNEWTDVLQHRLARRCFAKCYYLHHSIKCFIGRIGQDEILHPSLRFREVSEGYIHTMY